jgi:hypothetical protein
MDQEPCEPVDAGDEEGVPVDLLELHEILEWKAAIEGGDSDGDPVS